jgi:two-component system KDP operon response regulator KdpE
MNKKILIVDDEELVRSYVRRALSSRGWNVSERPDGASALELIAKENFEVVICDLKMPDMRGEEVVRRVRGLRPAMKIIVITGSVSNITSPIVPGVNVDGFLIKPFGIGEIRDMADKVAGA